MSTTYAGTATYPATITTPDDGDPANVLSVNPAFEGLADRTAYLKARNHLLTVYQVDKSSAALLDTASGPSALWTYASSVEVLANVKAGDILEIRATYLLVAASPPDAVRARLTYDGTGIASTTQICTGSELRVTFNYVLTVPSDDASVPISIEIKPDSTGDAELYGFGHTTVLQHRANA